MKRGHARTPANAGRVWTRVIVALAVCLTSYRDLAAAAGSLAADVHVSGRRLSFVASQCLGGDNVFVRRGWGAYADIVRGGSVGACGGLVLQLRGGGRGHPKATAEEYDAVEDVELTDKQALDLRRHWKRKPEWLEVKQSGVKKLVKTKTLLNVMKDRDRLEQKRRKSLPLHLVDLGLAGVAWVRELVGWDTPSKFRPLLHTQHVQLPAATAAALEHVESVLSLEDGYAIAREVKPRLVQQLALTNTDGMSRRIAADLMPGGDTRVDTGQPDGTVTGTTTSLQALPPSTSDTDTDTHKDTKLIVGAEAAEALSHVGSHTYGEIASAGFAEILQIAQPQEGEVFIDLGSGSGKAVLVAAALYPFSKAVGIEFVGPLHAASSRLASLFEEKVVKDLKLYSDGSHCPPEIEMVLGDMTQLDWTAYGKTSKVKGQVKREVSKVWSSVVFAACTCWSDETLADLVLKAGRLKKGSRLITMSRLLDLDNKVWKLVSKTMGRYGKGRMTFNVHLKIA